MDERDERFGLGSTPSRGVETSLFSSLNGGSALFISDIADVATAAVVSLILVPFIAALSSSKNSPLF